jgi:hypothetical protein
MFPAGIEHKLLFVLKGFQKRYIPKNVDRLLGDFDHQILVIDDCGYDIGAYFAAAQSFDAKYFCFLNSFSEILGENWLLKLYRHLTLEGVGMAAASGSWESIYSNFLIACQDGTKLPHKQLMRMWRRLSLKVQFVPFPNPHLRTNGFIISRDLVLRVKKSTIRSKKDAHLFESGKNGLSSQIRAMGFKLILVGLDGQGFNEKDWYLSNTFRFGNQKNLLIADNQTYDFQNKDLDGRKLLSKLAWGDKANDCDEY